MSRLTASGLTVSLLIASLLAVPLPAAPALAEGGQAARPATFIAETVPPDMAAAALLMSGQNGGDLPLAVATRRLDGRLEVAIELPNGVAPDSADPPTADPGVIDPGVFEPVEVFVYLLGDDLEVLRAATLRLTPAGPGAAGGAVEGAVEGARGLRLGLTFEDDDPDPGRGGEPSLHVLVRRGEALAARSLGLATSPSPPADGGAEDRSAWLEVAPATLDVGVSVGVPAFSAGSHSLADAGRDAASPPRRRAADGAQALLRPRDLEQAGERARRSLLEAMATAPTPDALVGRLLTLETKLADAIGPAAIQQLHEAERRVLQDLERPLRRRARQAAGRDDENADGRAALLAWAFVHRELRGRLLDARRARLAHRHLDPALDLARRVAEVAAETDAAADAGRLLALVAFDEQRRGQLDLARRLFEEALALAPDDPAVVHGDALNRERLGDSEGAAQAFERRLDLGDARPEIRLRLAINQLRAGRRAEGRELLHRLAGLAGDADQAWIVRLAHHELARLHLGVGADGDFSPPSPSSLQHARQVIERGLARFPRDPALHIARARALDLLGEREEARALLADLSPRRAAGPDQPPSPRSRYNSWPSADVDALERRLAATAAEHFRRLGRAAGRQIDDAPEPRR